MPSCWFCFSNRIVSSCLCVCVETADSNGISLTADLAGSGNVQGVLGLTYCDVFITFLNAVQGICGWDVWPSCYLCFRRLTQVFSVWMRKNMTASYIQMMSCYKQVEQEEWDVWSAEAHTDAPVSLVFAVAVLCVSTFLVCMCLLLFISSLLIFYSLIYFVSSLFFLSRFVPYLISFSGSSYLFSASLISSRLWFHLVSSHLVFLHFSNHLFSFSSCLFHSSLVSHLLCLVVSVSCSLLNPHLVFFASCFHLFSRFIFFISSYVFLVSSNQVSYFLLSNLVSCLVSYACILSLFSFQIIWFLLLSRPFWSSLTSCLSCSLFLTFLVLFVSHLVSFQLVFWTFNFSEPRHMSHLFSFYFYHLILCVLSFSCSLLF